MSVDQGSQEQLARENEALRRQVAALKAEAARFTTTLHSIGDAVISVDTGGSILQMNPAAEVLTGWSQTEATGQPLGNVFRIVNEETGAVESPVERVLREGVAVGLATRTLLAKDGRQRPIAGRAAPVRNERGETTGVVLVFRDQTEGGAARDITERKRMEERLSHLNVVLEAIRNVNQLIVRENDPARLIQQVCDMLVEIRGYRAVWIALEDQDGPPSRVAQAGWGETFELFSERLRQGKLPPCWGKARAAEDGIAMLDPRETCRDCPLWEAYRHDRAGVVPLRHGGQDLGTLGICLAPGAGDDQENLLLVEVAGDLAFALHTIEGNERRHHAEERFRVSFESAAIGEALTSCDGRFLRVNDALAAMLGYRADEMEGRPFANFTHPDDIASSGEAVRALLAGAVTQRFTKRYLRKDGSVVWADVNVAAARDTNGQVQYFIASLLDISDRKRAEHAMKASETRYRRLFEAAKDGILILDAESGLIVDVNPFLMELLGHPREDFFEKHLWEIGPFKDVAASKASFAELQTKEYVRYEDLPLQAHDGRKVSVEFVSNVYRVDGRKVIQCNIRDITERKRAEAELRFRNLILSTQQEASIDGILVVDVNGKIISSNQRFVDLWDIPLDILESKSDERALQLVMDKLNSPGEFIEKVNLLHSIPTEKTQEEITLKDGRTFDRYSSPMIGADGKHFGRVWYFRDVTSRKRAEAEREKLEEQLRMSQKMEAIGRLAGGVAHDFNNLLTVILSFTRFAMEATTEGAPLMGDLLEVKTAAERAVALTRQLLAFSRKQMLQPESLSLNQIAADLEKMLRRILGEDIDFVQVLAPDLGVVQADPSQIEQVLMNLVVNARDAMPRGGQLTIETANVEIDEEYAAHHVAVKPGPYVQLTVTDTGGGMDEQTRARLFEPFFTTKETGKGTGLGLCMVYGIVKQSGGNIWVYSELGHGTTFKIYLPRKSDATTTIKPASVPRRTTGTETILVVEDEEALRKVARRALEADGYTVLTAADGDEALRTCTQHAGDIQLLVTDVIMPRMSGRSVAQALSNTRPTLKVLYMSGYTDDAIVHHGVLDEGTHFLGKPFTGNDLTRKVREVLDEGINEVADGHEQPVQAAADVREQPLDKDALRALPQDLLARLRRAVIAARYDEIVEIVETLRITEPELAAGLRRLADLFDYHGMRQILGR